MPKYAWKVACILLLLYTVIAGFLTPIPDIASTSMLEHTIRNLYFHVPMWFGMIIILFISVIYSILYIKNKEEKYDWMAVECANVGILFGILGCASGAVWAKFTWGEFWPNDAKLNGAAISVMMYCAYAILRNGIDDPQKRGRVSAIYNIFSFPIFMVLVMVLPRINDSLHPGNGGNPAFGTYDITNTMRMVFYPAIIGWTLLGWWLVTLNFRIKVLKNKINPTHAQNTHAAFSPIDRD